MLLTDAVIAHSSTVYHELRSPKTRRAPKLARSVWSQRLAGRKNILMRTGINLSANLSDPYLPTTKRRLPYAFIRTRFVFTTDKTSLSCGLLKYTSSQGNASPAHCSRSTLLPPQAGCINPPRRGRAWTRGERTDP